jgi:hypothetical protein
VSVFFKVHCPSCGRERSEEFECYTEQEFRIRWDRWAQGRHVNEAFPELSPRQREAMQTGVCDSCWEKIFDEPSTKG